MKGRVTIGKNNNNNNKDLKEEVKTSVIIEKKQNSKVEPVTNELIELQQKEIKFLQEKYKVFSLSLFF
jgi:hypothetical protein